MGTLVDMAETISDTVGTRALKERLSEFVGRVQFRGEHLKVTKNGKLVAVVVPVEWYVANGGRLEADARESADS